MRKMNVLDICLVETARRHLWEWSAKKKEFHC